MARRPFNYERMSRLAAWSYRLALFALVAAVLAIIVVRSDLLEVGPALATFGAALACAVLAILLAFGSFVPIWRQGLTGLGRATGGLLFGLLLLAYPGYLAYGAWKLPPITDVSTDPGNPPRFEALARLRAPVASNLAVGAAAERQRQVYPDIAPLQLSVPPKVAFDVALGIVTKHKWPIAGTRPPATGRRDSLIEATARTTIMGLREDLIIRVTPLGAGARVDLRSASRYGFPGFHDFGSNVARVRALLEEIDDAASTAPIPPPEPEKRTPPQRQQPQRPAPRR